MLTSLYALEFRLRNDCLLGTCQDFMSGRAVSHTQSQLDDYADQCNPNDEEYAGSDDDRK